jgi:gliding motility-associated-like protein
LEINTQHIFSKLIAVMLGVIGTVFSSLSYSQSTLLQKISSVKQNRDIMVYASENNPVVWEYDSLRLIKFDECGTIQWQNQYNFTRLNRILLVSSFAPLSKQEFGFVTTETHSTHSDSRVTLIDSNGNISWSHSFHMTGYSLISYSLIENKQGELFVYGSLNPIGAGSVSTFLYKLNRNGHLQWMKSYNLGGIWGGGISTSDNGFLLRTGLRFIKLDSTGTVQWATNISDLGNYFFSAPIELEDGYVFNGTNSGSSLSLSFFKIDKSGNLATIHKKTINYNSINRSIAKKNDSTFTCILNGSLSRNLPTLVEFDKDLSIKKKNTLTLSSSVQRLTGSGVAFLKNGNPIVTGVIDSSFTHKPYFGVLDNDYKLGCDTSIQDSMFTETVTQSFPTVNATNQPLPQIIDSSYSQQSLTNTLETLCQTNIFSLDLGNDTALCPNSEITLSNQSPSLFQQFLWSTGATTPTLTVNHPGIYVLTATNICHGISVSDTIQIDTIDFPSPSNLYRDTVLCENSSLLIEAEIPLATYKWHDNSTNSSWVATRPGNYFVDISLNGCSKRFYYKVESCETLFIPNVFSPNMDGVNDSFKVRYLGVYPYTINIYNRWGNVIFTSKDPNENWDGTYMNKEVSEGVYFYVIEIGTNAYRGNISVFR